MNLKKKLSAFFQLLRPANLAVAAIKAYQLCISPYLGKNCRFYPTCSQYAVEAIRKKGFLKGSVLAVWRVLRCNPFGKGGYDPVK